MNPSRVWIILGGLSAILAIIAGATSAHYVSSEKAQQAVSTAAQYQMWHSIAFFIIAWLSTRADADQAKWYKRAGQFFGSGIVLFSGSLYGFAFYGSIAFPLMTPIGGLSFILGWVFLVIGALKTSAKQSGH